MGVMYKCISTTLFELLRVRSLVFLFNQNNKNHRDLLLEISKTAEPTQLVFLTD